MAFLRQRSKVSSKLAVVFEIGDLVQLTKKRQGIIKFVGQLHNRDAGDGVWYGIELTDDNKGDNNGNMGKTQYFECKTAGKGIFVRPKELIEIISKALKDSRSGLHTVNEDALLPRQDTVPDGPEPPDMNMSDDEYPMNHDAQPFEPSRSPSEQVRLGGHSNLIEMLQKLPKPKHNGKSRVQIRKYSKHNGISREQDKDIISDNVLDRSLGMKRKQESDAQKRRHLEREIEKLQNEMEKVCDSEMESKRLQMKTELDNLRPIELVEKLSEFIRRNELKPHQIAMLQKMIDYEPR